jgi:hypothetical protein
MTMPRTRDGKTKKEKPPFIPYTLDDLPPHDPPRTLDDIKALTQLVRVNSIEDLLATDRSNDPFCAPYTPTGRVHAQWFADTWGRCGYTGKREIHLRRMHYYMVNVLRDVMMPDTLVVDPARGVPSRPYLNTDPCFEYLDHASLLARALGLVDPTCLVDHRNPQTTEDRYVPPLDAPSATWDEDRGDWDLPELSATLGVHLDFTLPALTATGYDYWQQRQPYLLEIWIEKTTQDEVLAPLVHSHGVRIVTSAGFQSATNVIKHLQRVARAEKPARISYISDYDPAGRCMPPAVARYVERYSPEYAPNHEIKLTQVALTREQVVHYGLPRIPIKESDVRKGNFEDIHGQGAVELDALEALHEGELRRLLAQYLDPYVDRTLRRRLAEAKDEANEQLQDAWDAATSDLQDEARDLEADDEAAYAKNEKLLSRVAARLERDLGPIRDRLSDLQARIVQAQEAFEPPELEAPEPEVDPPDEADWLYSSDRSYLEQNAHYQSRKLGWTMAEWQARAETERATHAADWAMMKGSFPEGCPPYNALRHTLGRLCKWGHEHGTTGQTLRVNGKSTCLECHHRENFSKRRSYRQGDPIPPGVYDPTQAYLRMPLQGAGDDEDEDDGEDA